MPTYTSFDIRQSSSNTWGCTGAPRRALGPTNPHLYLMCPVSHGIPGKGDLWSGE